MKQLKLAALVFLALVLLACGEVPTPPAPGGDSTPASPKQTPALKWGEAQPQVDLVLADLLTRTKVATATVVSVEAVQWPDGCLGCAQEGEMCTQVIVPGYRIVLQAGEQQYEYRTDSGTLFRLCPKEWGAAQDLVDHALADLTTRTQAPTATVVAVDEVEWPDGCLGCAREGEMCTDAIVPGYRIVLQAGGQEYEYRAGASGVIRACPAAPTWNKEAQELVDKARADLADRLQLNQDQIAVVSMEQMMWRDSSIGCPQEGQAYLTVIVPGYRIVLEAEGTRYSYHAGDKGEVFWCEKPAQ